MTILSPSIPRRASLVPVMATLLAGWWCCLLAVPTAQAQSSERRKKSRLEPATTENSGQNQGGFQRKKSRGKTSSTSTSATATPTPSRSASDSNASTGATTGSRPAAAPARPSPAPAEPTSGGRGASTGNGSASSASSASGGGASGGGASGGGAAAVSSLTADEIADFDKQPEAVRQLLTASLELTTRNLGYTYGSADPAKGGMDCSGTIYYLLRAAGFDDVPRQANEQYAWVRQRSHFYAVLSTKADGFELKEMRPGDLLFWTGTYKVDRDPPVTHTMIYLGRRKRDGKPLMFGASDGRSYDGQRRSGVSVFDFKVPGASRSAGASRPPDDAAAAPDNAPDFAGYGPIPGMAERNEVAARRAASLGSRGATSAR